MLASPAPVARLHETPTLLASCLEIRWLAAQVVLDLMAVRAVPLALASDESGQTTCAAQGSGQDDHLENCSHASLNLQRI